MDAFATVGDLEARWRPLSADEQDRATVLLSDASVMIVRLCEQGGIRIDPTDGVMSATLAAIVCEMVKRAMMSPVDRAPATNTQTVAGPYSESVTFANPTGDLYLTSSERARIGIGGGRLCSLRPAIRTPEGGGADGW